MNFRLVSIQENVFGRIFKNLNNFDGFITSDICILGYFSRSRVNNFLTRLMSISVQPYLSLGVFENTNLVAMGFFYTVDESVKRALGGDGDRNRSALVVDGPLEETTEADHRVELEEEVEELTTEMVTTMSDDLNELTLESIMAELGLYLPVVEVRLIRFLSLSLVCSL